MDKLPVEITRIIYAYDPTYKERFDTLLKQLNCHCLYIIVINASHHGIHAIVIAKFARRICAFAIKYYMMRCPFMKMN